MDHITTTLTLMRQWLVQIADRVPRDESRKVYDKITEVDDTLWKLIFNEERSPWSSAKRYSPPNTITVSDSNFDETVEQLKEGKLNVRGQSEPDSNENS